MSRPARRAARCSAPRRNSPSACRGCSCRRRYPLTQNPDDGQRGVAGGRSASGTAKRLSYHNDFTDFNIARTPLSNNNNPFRNPLTNRGPIEGRPPGEFFAHQRWDEFFPKVGYVMSWGQMRSQAPSSTPVSRTRIRTPCGCYGTGRFVQGSIAAVPDQGPLRRADPDPHLQQHAGQPRRRTAASAATRRQLHFHNAHNGAESDGATDAHHFPGTFYDYRWSTTLARRDKINTQAPTAGPPGRTATAASSRCRATSASCRAPCGPTTTASSSPPRTSTRAISAW